MKNGGRERSTEHVWNLISGTECIRDMQFVFRAITKPSDTPFYLKGIQIY